MSSQETYADYLPHIKARWEAEQTSWEQRRQQAWIVVRQIADMLRTTFDAKQLIVFGSLADKGPFDDRSDIDLAVGGMRPTDFFRAYAQAMAVSSTFKLDLVDLDDCPTQMRQTILRSGVPL